jgi:Rap1a immunity proteins
MRRRTAFVGAAIILSSAQTLGAETNFRTVAELARHCIADDRSACVNFIAGSIQTMEARRQARNEPTCLAGQSSQEQTIKTFVRALLTKYAYSDLSASAAVEAIYQENCARPN